MTEEAYRAACDRAVVAAKAYADAILLVRPDLIAAGRGLNRRERDRIERESGLVDQFCRIAEAL